jgi:SPP1 gp7 family putative phage head morphogenesis protein
VDSVNDWLLSENIRHAVDVTRYSNGVVQRIIGRLNALDRRLYAELVEALERLSASSFTVERMESLLGSIRALNAAAYQEIGRELTAELRSFTRYEASYQAQALQQVLPATVHVASISAEQAFTAAYAQPFRVSKGGAVPMAQYLVGLSEARAKMIRDAVSLGYLESETTDQIVRRIRGTRSAKYEDGLMEGPRQHIEGMVRTATNHMANVTQQRVYSANADIVKGWLFHATMDGRTSLTCASLNGKVFKVGEGPVPPRHINCRSAATPVLKSFREMGLEIPEVVIEGKTRASIDGQIPAGTTFSDWLRSKPAKFQDQILGATRGQLFRANKMNVDRFANNKGVVYTLDQLRQRDSDLFKKAGL